MGEMVEDLARAGGLTRRETCVKKGALAPPSAFQASPLGARIAPARP